MTCKSCGLEKRSFNIKFYNQGGGWVVANTFRKVRGDYEKIAFITYRGKIRHWWIPQNVLGYSIVARIEDFARRVKEGKR